MIDSTRAIVLHQIKYSDSGIIVQFFTREYGRLSCLVRGFGNRKSGRNKALFQPLSVLDLSFYYKDTREIHTIKDFSPVYSPTEIWSDIKKCSVAIFLGEVLTSVLREESPNKPLYQFIENSVNYFNESDESDANFHLAFMARLTGFLGFAPVTEVSGTKKYFDMLNGRFINYPPEHSHFANPELSEILAVLFSSSPEKTKNIILTGSLRNEVLDIIVNYFALHLPGLKRINSLEVLRQVFIL